MLGFLRNIFSRERKEKISEGLACEVITEALRRAAEEMLPDLTSAFEGKMGGLTIENPKEAATSVFLALATIELASLPNVFPPEQAHRLWRKFFVAIESKLDDRARIELSKYRAVYYDKSRGWEPIHCVCERLLHYLLTPDAVEDPPPLTTSPLKTMLLMSYVVNSCGKWKILTEKHTLVSEK